MRRTWIVLICAVLVPQSLGCGKSGFSSQNNPDGGVQRAGAGTGQKPGEPNPAGTGNPGGNQSTPGITPPPGSGLPPGGGVTLSGGDADALGKCLRSWGNHPFGPNPVPTRRISASVQVLGFGPGIKDDQPTSGPALILIDAAVGVLTHSQLQLLNPNGWYCLKVDVNVLSKTQIELACQARLADARVNVGVLSNNDPAGVVGVQVLSDVKVVRRPGC